MIVIVVCLNFSRRLIMHDRHLCVVLMNGFGLGGVAPGKSVKQFVSLSIDHRPLLLASLFLPLTIHFSFYSFFPRSALPW